MNIVPGRGSRIMLALLPFILIAIVYVIGSAERRAANPDDKLLPPISEMAATVERLAFEPDRRTGEYVLWTDTAASLRRLTIGLGIATLIGACVRPGARPSAARGCRRSARWSRCCR